MKAQWLDKYKDSFAALSFVFVCLLFTQNGIAREYVSHTLTDRDLVIVTDNERVILRPLSDHAIEVLYKKDAETPLPSFSLIDVEAAVNTELSVHNNVLHYDLPGLKIKIQKSPFKLSYFQGDDLLIEEEIGHFETNTVKGFRFSLQPDEKLMGGGQRVLGMDRRGHEFPLYNRAHYGYTTESNQMYYGLPAVMSNKHYALFFDNSAKGNLDIGHDQHDVMQFDAVAGRSAYVVVAGRSYPKVIAHLTEVTGRQPLPPRWALGNFASRFGYRTEQETRSTVESFIEKDIPLDAVVLDLYWFGPDIKGHMGNLDWDQKAFPTPELMMTDFDKKGIKTILITEPFVLSSSKRWEEAVENNALAITPSNEPRKFNFYFGNTGLVDVFSQPGQQWFSGIYDSLSKQGVAGWWGDLGEPEVHPYDLIHQYKGKQYAADELHNVYGHQWAKLVYEQQRKFAPNKRPLILMRSGFIGSQRYGMIPWTGDVSRSWDGLKPQVELSLQMSVFGLAYTHSDLGGFAGGDSFDKEMYIRWLQYGVFQPVYRPHAQENIAPEPIFHDEQTQDILRRYIKLRYALLPYNYSLAYENSLTGMPLMRPMVFEDERNSKYFDMADQYLWGSAFLVKPITEAGIEKVDVVLPEGIWFDFWNKKRYQGDQSIIVPTNLEHLPVFVRAGSFIPSVESAQSTEFQSTQELNIDYYFDKSVSQAAYIMYDDNGENPNAVQSGTFQKITMNYSHSAEDSHLFSFNVKGDYKAAYESRKITLTLHNWSQSIHKLTLLNPLAGDDKRYREVNLPESAYIFDENEGALKIHFNINSLIQVSIN